MEVDEFCHDASVFAPAATVASVSISLHPLVIMNISDHWTRVKAQLGFSQRVYGALIGKQSGRHIEIMNSFELDYQMIDGSLIINREYYSMKEAQFKQVFSEMDFLGWYTTGIIPALSDVNVHRQMMDINESPLLLMLHPEQTSADLPVSVYESIGELCSGERSIPRTLFVQINFTLETEEAERIGLDYVTRLAGASTDDAMDGQSESLVTQHLQAQHSAVKMLASRVRQVASFVRASAEVPGDAEVNHEILRDAKALADRLPVLEPSLFQPEFYKQYNDVALMEYMAVVMKSCYNLNQFVNKFNALYQRQSTGRRIRGIFF